jgi:MinD superfamily P-loop ATPase
MLQAIYTNNYLFLYAVFTHYWMQITELVYKMKSSFNYEKDMKCGLCAPRCLSRALSLL